MNAATRALPRIEPVTDGSLRPKVSVVTATWNARDALEKTIESVAAADFDLEHIIVDGGSNDGTADDLTRLGGKVRWISEPDHGIADAMNKGIVLARGEWILVLHAGDTFASPERLFEADKSLTSDIDILLCGIRIGGIRPDRERAYRFPRQRLLFKPISHQSTLCRRAMFENIGGFDAAYKVTMDYDFFLRCRSFGARFKSIPLVLSRMDDGGVSSRVDWASLQQRFAEERRVQLAQKPGPLLRMIYGIYWPLYLTYRRFRSAR